MVDELDVISEVNFGIDKKGIQNKDVERILSMLKNDLEYFMKREKELLKQSSDLDSNFDSGGLNKIVGIAFEYDSLTKVTDYIRSFIGKIYFFYRE